MKARTFEITLQNRRRRVRTWGDPTQGPTWVLLHDGLGCLETWRDFPERLAHTTKSPVLAYDRPGHGGSEGPPSWVPEALEMEAAQGLGPLLEACGVRTSILLGHSDGGTLAVLAALQGLPGIRGLLIEAAHTFLEDRTLEGLREAQRAYETGPLAEALRRHHGPGAPAVFQAWCQGWQRPDLRTWQILDRIEPLPIPTIFLQGTQDAYGTEAQIRALEPRWGPRFQGILLPNIGHSPHRECPDIVLETARSFRSRLMEPT